MVFRNDLTRALDEVAQLPDTEDSLNTAQGIVAAELDNSISRVRAEAARPGLQGLAAGVRNLGLRALGTGAVVGASMIAGDEMSAAGAMAQLGLDSSVDFSESYIRSKRAERSNKAVKDIILSFRR